MKKNNTMLNVALVAFVVAGLIVLAVGLNMFVKHYIIPDYSEPVNYTFNDLIITFTIIALGLICIVLSMIVFFRFVKDSKVKGQTVTGVVTGFEKNEKIEMNGVNPFRIKGTFISPFSNTEKEFISRDIWENEDWFNKNVITGDKVDVIVKNDRKFKADVDSILRYKGIVEF